MIEIAIIFAALYASYRVMRKPGERFFYHKDHP